MAFATFRKVSHVVLAILFYIGIALDFTWWTLIQKGDVLTVQFDYIVVGGGTGGSVAAGRLSENGKYTVLLLEAGPSPSFFHKVPLVGALCQRSSYDWGYLTEPQEHACLAMNEQRSFWPMGRLLGGSSQLNLMMYVRGQRQDYDRWGRLAPGWSYDEVRPYFDRSITYHGEKTHLGTKGPWHIGRGAGITSVDDLFVETGRRLGYKLLEHNSQSGPGLYYTDSNVINGYRHPNSDAFLHDRPNLHVVTNALVDKLVLEQGPLRAAGVTFSKFGDVLTVRARREVVVSAGAVNTPALLMRSGIGPADHLKEMGVSPLVDLPVGQNLDGHMGAPLMFVSREPVNLLPSTTLAALRQFVANGTGPVASNLCSSGLFYASSLSESSDWPDVQLLFCNMHFWAQGPGGGVDLNLQRQLYDAMLPDLNETTHAVSLFPYLLRPRSRGEVRLRSLDPAAAPLIQPNFLGRPEDVRILVEALRLADRVADTPPLKDILIRRVVLKPCRKFTGDAQLECQLRQMTLTIYHPASTCRMAPRDQGGVVDSKLRVYGVAGLRLMDASVMPFITSGNTNAPVAMIAEKGADMILQGL